MPFRVFYGVAEYLASQMDPADIQYQLQDTLVQIDHLTNLVSQLQRLPVIME